MFASQKEVDSRIKAIYKHVDEGVGPIAENAANAFSKSKELETVVNSLLEKIADVELFRQDILRDIREREEHLRQENKWQKNNLRMDCLRMASVGVSRSEEDTLRIASRMMDFIENGVYEAPEITQAKRVR